MQKKEARVKRKRGEGGGGGLKEMGVKCGWNLGLGKRTRERQMPKVEQLEIIRPAKKQGEQKKPRRAQISCSPTPPLAESP